MIKKILISLMSCCVVVSLILAFYCYFRPKDTNYLAEINTSTLVIPYPALKDYLLTNGDFGTHYLYFCQPKSDDCLYIQNTIMKTLEAEQGSSLSEIITFIDISELEETLSTNLLKDDWGIKNYPAFVAVTNNGGELTVNNYLEWDVQNPLSSREVKQWMVTNNIWSGLFEEQDADVLLPQ